MRRELKFRAYSEQDAIMYQPLSLRVIAQLGHDFSDNIKLMQFTGLKDKNDVDIYENDIIQVTNMYLTTYTKEVEWVDDEARFSFGTRADKTNLFYNVEVIGNIHEDSHLLDNNPELLEEKE